MIALGWSWLVIVGTAGTMLLACAPRARSRPGSGAAWPRGYHPRRGHRLGCAAVGDDARVRLRAGLLSLGVSVVLLGAKYAAYRLTGSTAILSDALESIVNVVAALFALGGLVFAGRPADRSHPYGHGKIEFFSAAFEGGLIAFAARADHLRGRAGLIRGVEMRQLGGGPRAS